MLDLLSVNDLAIMKSSNYRKILVERLHLFINDDFHGLVQILYRVDIDEKHLKNLLNENKTTDAAEIIADLIIDRQLQKIKSRRQFNQRDNNISEEDKW